MGELDLPEPAETMGAPRTRIEAHAAALANDPEFIAQCAEIDRKVSAGEDLGGEDAWKVVAKAWEAEHGRAHQRVIDLEAAAYRLLHDIDANITGSVADYLAESSARLRRLLGEPL